MILLVVIIGILVFLTYILLIREPPVPSKWKRKGLKCVDVSKVASSFEILTGKRSIMDRDEFAYAQLGDEDKFCAMSESPSPVVLVKDLNLLKKILIKDFDKFINMRDFIPVADKENNLVGSILGLLKGVQWRRVRIGMTPGFSSGKIKAMMEHFNHLSTEWVDMIQSQCDKSGRGQMEMEVMKSVNSYVVEVIASAVFGMRPDMINNPGTDFARMADKLAEFGWREALKLNFGLRFPRLFSWLGLQILNQEAVKYFQDLLEQSLKARLDGSVTRNDFQQAMVEAQRSEEAAGDGRKYLTNKIITANSVVFFLAGAQTTTAFIGFAIYQLAWNQSVQDRLREECTGLVNTDGDLDYDDVSQATYLEMVCSEVLRLHPGAFRLERDAEQDYFDEETGFWVPRGETVVIPVSSIHRDPNYYPNPDVFDPENFSSERKQTRSPYAFMPFGIGPRTCIGMRFALVESKALIAKLVAKFRIEPTAKSPFPVQSIPAGLQVFPPSNLCVKLTKL